MEVRPLLWQLESTLLDRLTNTTKQIILLLAAPDAQTKQTSFFGMGVEVIHHLASIRSYHQGAVTDDSVKGCRLRDRLFRIEHFEF
jgi:hypothetical protein